MECLGILPIYQRDVTRLDASPVPGQRPCTRAPVMLMNEEESCGIHETLPGILLARIVLNQLVPFCSILHSATLIGQHLTQNHTPRLSPSNTAKPPHTPSRHHGQSPVGDLRGELLLLGALGRLPAKHGGVPLRSTWDREDVTEGRLQV